MQLLSKIPDDRTVGFLPSEKESCSTLRGNAWAPVWGSLDKPHDVGVLSYLFYHLFKCFVMLVLV